MTIRVTRREFTKSSLLACSLMALGGTGCRRKASGLLIGVLLPRTGLFAQAGLACERAAKIASAFLEDAGLAAEIRIADTQSRPDIGVVKAQKLIAEGAHIIVGAFDSGTTAAIAQACEQAGVPFVINISSAEKITRQGYRFVFRNFVPSGECVRQSAQLINGLTEKMPELRTAVLTYASDTFGQSMYDAFKEHEKEFRIPFKKHISYHADTADLTTEVMRLKHLDADVLVPISRPRDAVMLVRECVRQRYRPRLIAGLGSPGLFDKSFHKILETHAQGITATTPWVNPGSRLTAIALKHFHEAYPDELFQTYEAFTLEALYIAAWAYRIAKSDSPAALQEALRHMDLEESITCGSSVRFDETGQRLGLEVALLQNQDGVSHVIAPHKYRERDFIAPPAWN